MNECEARQPKNYHLLFSPSPRKEKKTTVLLGKYVLSEVTGRNRKKPEVVASVT